MKSLARTTKSSFLALAISTVALTLVPLLGVSGAVAVTLRSGDILVTDIGSRAIIRVDPASGDQTVVSSGGSLTFPTGIAVEASGQIVVVDGVQGVLRVDPATGAQTVLSSGGFFVFPFGIAIEANGTILVADEDAFGGPGGIIRVNSVTGAQTPVSSGGFFATPSGIAIEGNGDILVTDQTASAAPFDGDGGVIRVNPVTGAQTPVSSGGFFGCPSAISLEASGNILANTSPSCASAGVLRVDPATGAQRSFFGGGFFVTPAGLAVEASANILVTDSNASAVIRVDAVTGGQTLVSSGENFINPSGIAIVPSSAMVPPPAGLAAIAGDRRVYLRWRPVEAAVDGFTIHVEIRVGDAFVPLPSSHVANSVTTLLVPDLTNGELYRFTVTAEAAGLESGPSTPVFAKPGAFAASSKPTRPILFLHGFTGNRDSFKDTRDFMESTLGWTYGGNMTHDGASTAPPPTDQPLDSQSDFFTVEFGSSIGHYPALPDELGGLLHQGLEVAEFITRLTDAGVGAGTGISVVAHSNGGLVARSFLVRFPELAGRVGELVTYGTPHRGADVAGLIAKVSNLVVLLGDAANSRVLQLFGLAIDPLLSSLADNIQGVRDASFGCGPTGIIYKSSFLKDLNKLTLPNIKYTSIVGHDHDNGLLDPLNITDFGERAALDDCHSRHWDGLVPITSQDLGQAGVTSSQVRKITTTKSHLGHQGNDFSATLCALDPNCVQFNVLSPVDIQVTAPDARSIAPQLAEIPGAAFTDVRDENGHSVVTVLLPFPIAGDYQIKVSPKANALPTDTFTITATILGSTTVLAQNMKIEDIPAGGFSVRVNPPFAALSVSKLKIDRDEFEMRGRFTIGAMSDGIDPLTEDVTLQVGTYSSTIPAGSFKRDGKRKLKFEGVVNGVELEVEIRSLGGGRFEFKAEGEGVKVSGMANPVTVGITIGNDGGQSLVAAEFKADRNAKSKDRDRHDRD